MVAGVWLYAKKSLGPVHTMPEKFKNSALFLWLGLPSTLSRRGNGAFQNGLQTGAI